MSKHILDHIEKSKHNEKFLNFVRENDSGTKYDYPDWLVTIAFYIAVHKVDAKLNEKGIYPEDHYNRNRFVAIELNEINTSYMFLYNQSTKARYDPRSQRKMKENIVDLCMKIAVEIIN